MPPLRAEPRNAANRFSRAFFGKPGPVSVTRMRLTLPMPLGRDAQPLDGGDAASSAIIACTALRRQIGQHAEKLLGVGVHLEERHRHR